MTTWLKHLEIHYPEIYKQLEFPGLSNNPNIRIKDVLDHPDENWKWEFGISCNSGIQLRDIIDNQECPWDWYWISINPNLTIEFAVEYKDKLDWYNVSHSIKFEDIRNHPELPWSRDAITENSNVTINDILDHPKIKWTSDTICYNTNITLDFVLNYFPPLNSIFRFGEIDWYSLSKNPAISLNDIITHPDYPWKWGMISRNPNMTIDFAIEYKKILDWKAISRNSGITMDDIIEHPELPWRWHGISENPNITPDFVMANFKHIHFYFLSQNPFGNRKNLTKKIIETTLGLSSVQTEYAHGRLPAHLVNEIIGHAYDTSAFTLHDMIKRIAPIIEYKP